MKNIFYFVTFIALILSSCSNDSDAKNNATRLTRMITREDLNPDLSERISDYTYDGKKLKDVRLEDKRWEYIYEGDNIVMVNLYSDNQPEFKTSYEYDSKGRVSSELLVDLVQGPAIKRVYTYNSDNTISFQEFYANEFTQTETGLSGKIYFNSKGQTVKFEEYVNNTLFQSIVWTYDAKNNPLKNIAGYAKLPMNFEKSYTVLTKNTYNKIGDLKNNVTFTYVYNAANYPIKGKRIFNIGGNSYSSQVDYFY